jgi:hypothetical protein
MLVTCDLELRETTAPAVAALGDDERAAVDEVVEILRGIVDDSPIWPTGFGSGYVVRQRTRRSIE